MNRHIYSTKNNRKKNHYREKIYNKCMLYLTFLLFALSLNLLKFDSAKKIKMMLKKELSRNIITNRDLEIYWDKIKNLNLNLLAGKIEFERKNTNSFDMVEVNQKIKNKMQEETRELDDIKKNFS